MPARPLALWMTRQSCAPAGVPLPFRQGAFKPKRRRPLTVAGHKCHTIGKSSSPCSHTGPTAGYQSEQCVRVV